MIELSRCGIVKQNKILLLFRKDHQEYVLPGGKLDQKETKEQAAVREVKEEINCDISLIDYLGFEEFTIKDKKYKQHLFLAKIIGKPRIAEKELFEKISWIKINDMDRYNVAPHVKLFCSKLSKRV